MSGEFSLTPGRGASYTQRGYSVWKRVPTAARPSKSCDCRDLTWLKKGGCLVIESSHRGADIVLNVSILD